MEKILVIHTNGMGDFIMFTPALKLLRKNYPEAKFYLRGEGKNELNKSKCRCSNL